MLEQIYHQSVTDKLVKQSINLEPWAIELTEEFKAIVEQAIVEAFAQKIEAIVHQSEVRDWLISLLEDDA